MRPRLRGSLAHPGHRDWRSAPRVTATSRGGQNPPRSRRHVFRETCRAAGEAAGPAAGSDACGALTGRASGAHAGLSKPRCYLLSRGQVLSSVSVSCQEHASHLQVNWHQQGLYWMKVHCQRSAHPLVYLYCSMLLSLFSICQACTACGRARVALLICLPAQCARRLPSPFKHCRRPSGVSVCLSNCLVPGCAAVHAADMSAHEALRSASEAGSADDPLLSAPRCLASGGFADGGATTLSRHLSA